MNTIYPNSIGNPSGTWYASNTFDPTPFYDEINRLKSELAAAKAAGLTDDAFIGFDDSKLILELIARGYAVYKPAA